MQGMLPSECKHVLRQWIGSTIKRVRRQLLRSDYESLPAATRDELSDGSIELHSNDGACLHFLPDATRMSILLGVGHAPGFGESYFAKDVTASVFWRVRVDRPIVQFTILKSRYQTIAQPSEFGLEVQLQGSLGFVIEWESGDEFSDTLRVVEPREPAECIRIPV